MTALLRFAHLLALGAWIGSVVFFSFVVAPSLFGALPRDAAGRAVSTIFPRYYAFGAACGALALLSGLLLGGIQAERGRALGAELVLVALMIGIVAYAGGVLLPEASRTRQALALAPEVSAAHDETRARFDRLHHRSVLLNGAVLLLGLAALALTVVRRPPH